MVHGYSATSPNAGSPLAASRCGTHSSLSVSRTARLFGVPIIPAIRWAPSSSALLITPGVSAGSYWSSPKLTVMLVVGQQAVLVGVVDVRLEARDDRRERGRGGAARRAVPTSRCLTVPSIGALARSGSTQSSVSTVQPLPPPPSRRWPRCPVPSVVVSASLVASVGRGGLGRLPRCRRAVPSVPSVASVAPVSVGTASVSAALPSSSSSPHAATTRAAAANAASSCDVVRFMWVLLW